MFVKKYFVFILVLVLSAGIALVGCEKKAEAPKPAAQPAMTPPPAPPPPAPAPAPMPAKPAKK
jgi:hypothetical protein